MKAGRGGRCRQRSSWGAPKSPFGKSSSYKPVSYVEECERVSGLLHLAELVAAVCQGSDWKGWGVHDGTSSAESPVCARESMGMPCGTQQDSWMSIWIGRGWRGKVAAGVCYCWCWVWARRGKRRALKQADSVWGARKADLCRNIPRLFSVPPLEKKSCTFVDFCSRQKVIVWNRDGFPSSVIRAWGSRILSGLSLSSPLQRLVAMWTGGSQSYLWGCKTLFHQPSSACLSPRFPWAHTLFLTTAFKTAAVACCLSEMSAEKPCRDL